MADNMTKSTKSRDEIAEAYKSEPWWYDLRGFFILTFAYNSTLGAQLRFFGPNYGAEHLEVACGTGTLLELILRWRKWKKKIAKASDASGAPVRQSTLGRRQAVKPPVFGTGISQVRILPSQRSFHGVPRSRGRRTRLLAERTKETLRRSL